MIGGTVTWLQHGQSVLLLTDGAQDFSLLQNVQVVFVGQKNDLHLNVP
jgi:hypothetical protein